VYSPDRDDSHAASLYSLLENEIVPLYYEEREHGMPVEWMRRVKQSLKNLSGRFNCERMIEEYRDNLYVPAHVGYSAILLRGFEPSRERVRWNRSVAQAWPNVKFLSGGLGSTGISTGRAIPLEAEVDLAGLAPGDVRVEAVVGRVAANGEVEDGEVVQLRATTQRGPVWYFSQDYQPKTTGRLGLALRISSNHFDNPLNRPCNTLLKWADR
jgi:starch phosphorylase